MQPNPLLINSVLLSAALAGLAEVATEADAATVFTESVDFSDDVSNPADLSATWSDFTTSGGIAGTLSPGISDYGDAFTISAPANTQVEIPYSARSSSPHASFGFAMYDGSEFIGYDYLSSMPIADETYFGVLSFNVPASGKVTFVTSYEGGGAEVLNYTIGATIPEVGSSVLGLAGLAAAALRRRR
jgi:hypothetical protein